MKSAGDRAGSLRSVDSEPDGDVRVVTRITRDRLEGLASLESLGTTADGAVLVFHGRVRETNQGRAVTRLDYEAYGEMAERELRNICREAADRFAIGAIEAAHRVGDLELGDVSVAIGVAAPHRDACYEASRWVIEEIKVRLPIWKHEHYEDGESHWVGAPESLDSSLSGPGPDSTQPVARVDKKPKPRIPEKSNAS